MKKSNIKTPASVKPGAHKIIKGPVAAGRPHNVVKGLAKKHKAAPSGMKKGKVVD